MIHSGVDVLHQKSELSKKLEQRRDDMKKKELEEHQRSKRSSLEVRLEQQANKLKPVGICEHFYYNKVKVICAIGLLIHQYLVLA